MLPYFVIMGLEESLTEYLTKYSQEHEEFKTKFESKDKTIKGCAKYITNIVKEIATTVKANCGQLKDEDAYTMAVQYFMDDNIKEEKPKSPAPTETKTETKDTGKKKASEKFKKTDKKAESKTEVKKETKKAESATTKAESKADANPTEHKFIQLALF